ncbi:MAG: hypothetical protein PVF32_21450, partial [Desulfobacterales bacterium]
MPDRVRYDSQKTLNIINTAESLLTFGLLSKRDRHDAGHLQPGYSFSDDITSFLLKAGYEWTTRRLVIVVLLTKVLTVEAEACHKGLVVTTDR